MLSHLYQVLGAIGLVGSIISLLLLESVIEVKTKEAKTFILLLLTSIVALDLALFLKP